MRNKNLNKRKKTYTKPQFQIIVLDKEISLQLESNPPVGPNEAKLFELNGNRNEMFLNHNV